MSYIMDEDSSCEGYSFHLDYAETESTYSNQPSMSDLSTLHKQRIDTLFRSKRRLNQRRQQQKNASEQQNMPSIKLSDSSHLINKSKHRVLIHNTVNDSPKIQRQSSNISDISSSVSIRQNPSTIINITDVNQPASILTGNRSDEHYEAGVKKLTRHNTSPQEELTQAFGGRTLRQKSFRENRSAVQAQIEKLFIDAGKNNNKNNNARKVTNKATPLSVSNPPPPPPPPKTPNAPPPPSLKTHPAFRNSPIDTSPPTLKRGTPSPISLGMQSNCSTVSRTSTVTSSNSSGSVNSNMVYRVDYLGAIQLPGKATSLDVLQDPLKQLYYKHKHNVTMGKRTPLSTLSITDAGLRVMRNTSIREELDFTNSFTSIAVWAAIKMVIKKKINNSGQVSYTYAFLPLICDPDVQEKFNTYHPLNVSDPTIMDTTHPPMFACVMRKINDSNTLECHGFICRSSEDAIVIAANLYQALLGTMNLDAPTTGNFSVDSTKRGLDGIMSDSEILPRPPPRRRKTPPSSAQGTLRRSNSEDMLHAARNVDGASNKLRKSIRKRNSIIEERKELAESNQSSRVSRSKCSANVQKTLEAQNSACDLGKKINSNKVDDILKTIINPNGMSFSEMDTQQREMLMKMALMMSKDEIYKRSKNIMRNQRSRSSGFLSGFESDSDVSTISSVLKATKKTISRFGSRASNSLRPSYLKERTPVRKFNLQGDSSNYQPKSNDSATKRLPGCTQIGSGNSLSQQNMKSSLPLKKAYLSRNMEERSIYGECCDEDSECSSKCYCTLPLQNENRSKSNSSSNTSSELNQIFHKKIACACESDSCAESEKCYCSLKNVKKSGLRMYEINLDSDTDTTVATRSTLRRKATMSSKRRGSQCYFSDNDSRTSSWNRSNERSKTSFTMERSRSKSPSVVISPKPETIRRQKSMSPGILNLSERNNILRSSRRLQNNTNTIRLNRTRTLSSDSVLRQSKKYRRNSGSLGSQGSTDSSRSSPGADSQHSDGSSEGDNFAERSSSSSARQRLMLSAIEPSGKVVHREQSQKTRKNSQNPSCVLSIKKTAEIAALFSELKLEQKTDLINRLQQQVNIDSTDSDEQHYEIMQNGHQSFMFSDRIESSLGYLP